MNRQITVNVRLDEKTFKRFSRFDALRLRRRRSRLCSRRLFALHPLYRLRSRGKLRLFCAALWAESELRLHFIAAVGAESCHKRPSLSIW